MTRARSELHLCAPLNYAATSRSRGAEPKVHAGRSPFMTDKVLDCCERTTFRGTRGIDNLRTDDTASVDIASQLKEMW
jgi:hypothetical protein